MTNVKKNIIIGITAFGITTAYVAGTAYLLKQVTTPEIYNANNSKNVSKQAVFLLADCPRCKEHTLEVDHSYAVQFQSQICRTCGYSINYDLETKTSEVFSKGYGGFQITYKDGVIDSGVFFKEPTDRQLEELKALLESSDIVHEESFIKVIKNNVMVEF